MDLTSYLLGKERGGGGGGTPTDVQINGTSITSNNRANIITNSAYNASSNKIATMGDVPVIDIVTITTTIDEDNMEELNSTDIAFFTSYAQAWYDSIDKTQDVYVSHLLQANYEADEYSKTIPGEIKYYYVQTSGMVLLDMYFSNNNENYNVYISFSSINSTLSYDQSLTDYFTCVTMSEFESTVGDINTTLEGLVSVEEGE